MKLKKLGFAVLSAMALLALGASTASATTLEVNGVPQNKATTLSASLVPEGSFSLVRTDSFFLNTCAASSIEGHTTSPFTDSGDITATLGTLSLSKCTRALVVHTPGVLHLEHIPGTTDATVTSSGAGWTFSVTQIPINCQTGEGTDLGVLTGVSSGHAQLHVAAVLNCGLFMPSAVLKGTYAVTTPTGLGISA